MVTYIVCGTTFLSAASHMQQGPLERIWEWMQRGFGMQLGRNFADTAFHVLGPAGCVVGGLVIFGAVKLMRWSRRRSRRRHRRSRFGAVSEQHWQE